MIIAVPAATPLTTPVVEPMVAIPVLLLLHVPPDVMSLSVVELPTQTLVVPVMGAGDELTNMLNTVKQPVFRM